MGNSLRHLFIIFIIFIHFSFIFNSTEYKKCGKKKDKKEDIIDENDCKPEGNELEKEEQCCYVKVWDFGKPHCTKVSKDVTKEMETEISDTLSRNVTIKCFNK